MIFRQAREGVGSCVGVHQLNSVTLLRLLIPGHDVM